MPFAHPNSVFIFLFYCKFSLAMLIFLLRMILMGEIKRDKMMGQHMMGLGPLGPRRSLSPAHVPLEVGKAMRFNARPTRAKGCGQEPNDVFQEGSLI